MVLEAAKWSELCGAKTPMMQRKGDKSQGGIAFTNTQRQQIHRCKIHKHKTSQMKTYQTGIAFTNTQRQQVHR